MSTGATVIDSHVHVVPPNLPGVGSLDPLLEAKPEVVADALHREMREAGVGHVLAMGRLDADDDDPLGVASTLEVARFLPGVHAIGVADPRRTDVEHLRRADSALASGRVKALKAYLGYLHYPPDHAGYRPYYELAEKHGVPIVFHTGDTYSALAKLRFARPLLVDEVAVDHPRTKFIVAHLGNPWLTDAAEVVYKNVNVWADLSALVIGDTASFAAEERRELLRDAMEQIRRAFRYAERPNRFLFGTDWPLCPLAAYAEFLRSAIPEVHHPLVFTENARTLFRI